jgi:hypothetical protein
VTTPAIFDALHLLEAVLDSWDRNNTIMLNLLRALPDGGLDVKAIESSPSVAQQFMQFTMSGLFPSSRRRLRSSGQYQRRSGWSSVTATASRRC